MKNVVRRALLLDFYGALLTEKQREIYDWYYQQDLSLGEIGDVAQVSRNAVHDLLSRADSKLERYEQALGLIAAHERQAAAKAALAADFSAWLAEAGEAAADGDVSGPATADRQTAADGESAGAGRLAAARNAAFRALVERLRDL
jgi:predicted DNA-binding protein YlxM (UPF0122 family)